MSFRLFVFFVFTLCVLGPLSARAQAVEDYLILKPAADWVVDVKAPPLNASLGDGRESLYALIDRQRRHDAQTDRHYNRIVVDLLSSSGVENDGALSINFDPAYEDLTLHHVRIIRDGQALDAIDLSESMIFRAETDRNQMIFNGELTFSMSVLDLRIGDRLDYAYTIEGRNPAVKTGFLSRRSFDYSYHISRLHYRVGVHDDVPLKTKSINDAPAPRIEQDGDYRVHVWDRADPQVNDYDGNVPAWTYRMPTYELSPMRDWDDVGNLFAPYYQRDEAARTSVRDIVSMIRSEHETDKAQAKAALDWVQQNIRYVAINLGDGGFIPRQPGRVLRRRFGDCKDVTLLLLTLLDELGVSAYPVLVNLDEKGGEFDGIAHPYAFDHIMVMAEIDGQSYPMDATRNPQMGTLDTMEKGTIRKGLRLRVDGSSVIDFPVSQYPYREKLIDTFDLVSEDGKILYSLSVKEYGSDADRTRDLLASEGLDGLQSNYVNYLEDIYPTLEVSTPLSVALDEDKAYAETMIAFTLDRSDSRDTLKTRAYEILGSTPDFEGGTRRSPFAIKDGKDTIHIRRYIIDERYEFEPSSEALETESFKFSYEDTLEDNLFSEIHRWTTKSDHMAVADFETDMQTVKRINNMNYTTVNLAKNKAPTSYTASFTMSPTTLQGLMLLLVGTVFLIARGRKTSAE